MEYAEYLPFGVPNTRGYQFSCLLQWLLNKDKINFM